jgi:hypothetical protein
MSSISFDMCPKAARMESTGKRDMIQISQATADIPRAERIIGSFDVKMRSKQKG